MNKKTRLQILREKVQQGGEDKQKILDKAVKYILNPKYGTLEKKYDFLINNLGLTESEYKPVSYTHLTLPTKRIV